MPTYRNPFKKGKLIIQFAVHIPARLNPAVAESLARILPPKEDPMIPGTKFNRFFLFEF